MQDNGIIQTTTENEKALIACILIKPELLEILDDITSKDFLDQDCSRCYSIMETLYNQGEQIDIVSIGTVDRTLNLFLVELVAGHSTSANYEYYRKTVKQRSVLRKLGELGSEIQLKALNAEKDPEQIIEFLNKETAEIYTTKKNEIRTSEDIITEVLAGVDKLINNPRDVIGITTGFPRLDSKLNGLHNSDLIILAARPARGKSSLALQLAKNVALYNGTPTLFFSLEMSNDQLIQRLIASESKVELGKIRSGKLDQAEQHALKVSGETLSNLPLYFNDRSAISIRDIKNQIKSHNIRNPKKIGFVVVDYLQLMAVGNGGRDNMVQMVTEISRGLKMIAKDFNIPVLALSQLSRDVEKRAGKPKLSDLRDSGSIEQDADIVCFLHSTNVHEDSYGEREIELLVEKHRSGPCFDSKMSFNGAKMLFTETHDIDNPMDW